MTTVNNSVIMTMKDRQCQPYQRFGGGPQEAEHMAILVHSRVSKIIKVELCGRRIVYGLMLVQIVKNRALPKSQPKQTNNYPLESSTKVQ